MKVHVPKSTLIAAVLVLLLASGPVAAEPAPQAAPDEATMEASLVNGADWMLTVTLANGQLSPPPGALDWEASSGGRMCMAGLTLLQAYRITGTQAYLERATACADLAVSSIDAGAAYVVQRTGVLPTEAGGGFPDAQHGKVDDAHQASYTGDLHFHLWESLRGIWFLYEMHRETGNNAYLNGAILLDRLIGEEFYYDDDPDNGLVDHITLGNSGTWTQNGIASTTEHAMMMYVLTTAGNAAPNLWKDQLRYVFYLTNLRQADGSLDDKDPLPYQDSASETRHALMVRALFDIGVTWTKELRDWVLDQQKADGSFDCPHDKDPYGDTTWSVVGLLPTGEVSAGGEALSWLIGRQLGDGSWPFVADRPPNWASKLYSTQWALLALHTGLTNYNLHLDMARVEAHPVWEGDPPRVMAYRVNVTVENQGLVLVSDASVRLYDGPRKGGQPMTETSLDVPALGEDTVSLEFRPDQRGPHQVHVWVDYAPGGEFRARDNNGSVLVNLNREPTGSILRPEAGQLFPFGAEVAFEAADVVDLDGDDVNLTWTDNVTGLLGHGANLTRVLPPGDHEVVLTLADGNGPTTEANVSFSIRHNIAPTIRISTPADGARYFDYQSITFNASASSDAENHDLFFTWVSDTDGVLGHGPRISRKLSPGTHTITVWVDDTWANVSREVTVHVTETYPPNVVITSPVDGEVYVTTSRITFIGNATTDPDSEILEFFWYSNINGLLSQRPLFLTRLAVGHHFITLAVDDGNYNVSETIEIDVLENRPPVAEILHPVDGATFNSTDVVELNASGSYDPEDIPTFFWVSDRMGPLGNTPIIELQLPRGEHRITLWVDDDHSHNESHTISITVMNLPPTAGISSPEPGATHFTGTDVRFMSASSSDPEGYSLSFEWFIRPQGGDWEVLGTGGSTVREFKNAGTYEVRLIVTDDRGDTDEATISFVVKKAKKEDGDDGPGYGGLATLAALLVVSSLLATAASRRRA